MVAQPLPTSEDLVARLLGPRDAPNAWRFLAQQGVRDVFLASQVWRGALEQRLPDGTPEVYGVFANGELRALLFIGLGGLAVPSAASPDELHALGPALARRAPGLRALVGPRNFVDVLWPYALQAGARARVDVAEHFLEADASELDPEAREPEMRPATIEDLDAVAQAASRAHLEEMGEDPLGRNPDAFLGRVARMILEARVFVVRRGDTLLFKAELSAVCPIGAQIAGVYTDPDHRNQGFARRGTAEVAWRTLSQSPRICLFVRADNEAARRAYERAGFRRTGDYRTILTADPRRVPDALPA
jgi:hypothetical protein